jgi:hypothetical protein
MHTVMPYSTAFVTNTVIMLWYLQLRPSGPQLS